MTSPTRRSVLIGLIGSGIGSSLSPAMHEREGEMQGLAYVYRTIDLDKLGLGVADLPELLQAAERMGYNGLNITFPCKQAVVGLLDELSDAAARIGAVNTVVFAGGRRYGHNTDSHGFVASFGEEIAATSSFDDILLLGAGGAGTAIAHGLLGHYPGRLQIFDTDRSRATLLTEQLAGYYGADRARVVEDVARAIADVDGVINATPVGMVRHPGCPLDPGLLRRELWVSDIIYFPLDTELVLAAEKSGCTVMRGGGMAVYQAAGAFERFTGIRPDVDRMKSHFNTLIRARPVDIKEARKATI